MVGGFSPDRRRTFGTVALAAVLALLTASAQAAGTAAEPSSPQPTLPSNGTPRLTPSSSGPPSGGPKPTSPVVESTLSETRPLAARKQASRQHARASSHRRHQLARRDQVVPPYLERPAVAGVALLVPLPRPAEPPHIVVPLPAYPLDAIATAFSTPPAPIVCHHAPREPGLPDPRLYRERTLRCQPDNP